LFVIAIDGPSGSGKSTIAKEIAKKFNFTYINTGSMYRAITLFLIEQNLLLPLKEGKIELQYILPSIDIELKEDFVYLNKEDVSQKIRSPEVTKEVSFVSSIPIVRKFLVQKQREMAAKTNAILEGRDIGTNVFPDAKLKIFLTAQSEQRALRRWIQEGKITDLQTVQSDLEKRDEYDSKRVENPLVKAQDAIEIDTTCLTIEEVVEQISRIIYNKFGDTLNNISLK